MRAMSTEHPGPRDNEPSRAPDRRVVRPPRALPAANPSSGPANADRLTALAHDLSNMIDGSMRWLGLAIAALPDQDNRAEPGESLGAARTQIETARATLERMGSMVDAAMRAGAVPIGSDALGPDACVSIGVAIDHAIDATAPLTHAAGLHVEARIDKDAGARPAGPLYTVVLNGIFNAVRACELAPSAEGRGVIEIDAAIDASREELVITITDDGAGLDPGLDPHDIFEPGGTSDPGDHSGLGLALARQIVEGLEGIIDLRNRTDGHPGAALTVRVPIPGEGGAEREIG